VGANHNRHARWRQVRSRTAAATRLRNYKLPINAILCKGCWGFLLLTALAWACAISIVLFAPATARAQPIPQATLQTIPQQAQRYRGDLVRAAHSQWGLDAPIAALAAQVHQESGWNAAALSPVGARGLTQFMPATAQWWCGLQQLPAAQCQPSNPVWALRSMAGYDKWLYDRTPAHYSTYDRLWVALRAYNGGMGHWNAEANVAKRLHQQFPTRLQADAACGTARRAALHCAESLGYPRRILVALQPRYASWGGVLP
jgi:soluble lytic murein transglycosylase-like protein